MNGEIGIEQVLRAFLPFELGSGEGALAGLALSVFAIMVLLFVFTLVRSAAAFGRSWTMAKLAKSLARERSGDRATLAEWALIRSVIVAGSIPWLERPFAEFLEQVWEDPELDRPRNLEQAGEYLTAEAVDPHWSWTYALPGILTAIGILGTFVGITIGLSGLDVGGVADATKTAETVETLVSSLGVSFRTSIWGLIWSILATGVLSWSDQRLEAARQRLVSELNQAVLRGSPVERLLRTQQKHTPLLTALGAEASAHTPLLAALGAEASAQTQVLRGVADRAAELIVVAERQEAVGLEQKAELQQLGQTIANAFEDAIFGTPARPGLVSVFEDNLKAMSENLASAQADGVGEVVENFLDHMRDNFTGSFDSLGQSIDTMVTSNSSYSTNMHDLVSRLEGAAITQAQATAHMNEAVDGAATTINQIRSSSDALQKSAEVIEVAASKMEQTLGSQSSAMAQQSELTARVTSAVAAQSEGWEVHRNSLSTAYSEIQGQFDGVGQAVRELREWHESVRNLLGDQLEQWNDGLTTQQALTKTLAAERAGFSELAKSLSDSSVRLRSLGGGLKALSERLQSEIGAMAEQESTRKAGMAHAVDALQSVGTDLGSTFQGYVEAARTLQQGIPDIADMIASMTTGVKTLSEALGSAEKLAQAQASSVKDQAKISASLNGIVESADAARGALEPTVTVLVSATEGLTAADRSLRGGATSLEKTALTLSGLAQSMRMKDEEARKNWDHVASAMSRTSEGLNQGLRSYSETVNSGLSSALGQFDTELKAAVSTLGSAILGLKETVEDLDDIIDSGRVR
jgi:ABC-type transporter Mla subunit MlaD